MGRVIIRGGCLACGAASTSPLRPIMRETSKTEKLRLSFIFSEKNEEETNINGSLED